MPTKKSNAPAPRAKSRKATASASPSGTGDAVAKTDKDHSASDEDQLDSNLLLVLELIEDQDFYELAVRTGIAKDPEGNPRPAILPLLVEFPKELQIGVEAERELREDFGVPGIYFSEIRTFKKLSQVTAGIALRKEIFQGSTEHLRSRLGVLVQKYRARLSLATPVQPSFEDSLADINIPVDREYNGRHLDGKKTIVGIIDDGCAFAHPDFMVLVSAPTFPASRVLYLWDQSDAPKTASEWQRPPDLSYGYELDNTPRGSQPGKIDAAIKSHVRPSGVVAEDEVYEHLNYEMTNVASHGTRVMGLAAGNGQSLMGVEGVASGADIIFVQLPPATVVQGSPALLRNILDGVTYIFQRAAALKRRAVVNISYGGYEGPHDGTTFVEKGIDGMLDNINDRAVVIAAGNGFEADCHAWGTVASARAVPKLRWSVPPEDPTPNDLEIWYDAGPGIQARVTAPDGTLSTGWIGLGTRRRIRRADGKIVGRIRHRISLTGNGGRQVLVSLRATVAEATDAFNAPSPRGTWTIELRKSGQGAATFHAWIARDDTGRSGGARRLQSRFAADDASPGYTIAGLATGRHTIVVGAHNAATQQVSRYSACGPTRDGRAKPDLLAPAEGDVAGRGALSSSSLRAQPMRMSGTSASAPHVAGTVALMLQYALELNKHLKAGEIRQALIDGAKPLELSPNAHQMADDTRPYKQQDVFDDLVGAGKLDVLKTLDALPIP